MAGASARPSLGGSDPPGSRDFKEVLMARFMVERSFPDGLEIPMTDQGAQACMSVVGTNAELGVTWVHSYVTEDHKKTFCIYDAQNPEAIRKAAKLNQLPADAITPVRVLDPYFYK